jgi:hypothetical protein
MAISYRTDEEKLEFLTKRIQRLEKTLMRAEALGVSSLSSAGTSKALRNQEDIRRELEIAEHEFMIIKARLEGTPVNPNFKEMVICHRKQY